MIRLRKNSIRTLGVFVVMLAWTGQASFAQPADDAPDNPAGSRVAEEDGDADDSSKSAVWSCPMHRQIRQPNQGKCPICAMELVAADEKPAGGILNPMSLQDMLAIALKHNPDVRAADAKLRSVEAELDRTRLEVVQRIIAFREKWQTQRFAVQAAEREQVEAGFGAKTSERNEMVTAAKEKLAFQRAKLSEVEAELPFLLGQAPGRAVRPADSKTRQLIRDELLPKARQMLQLRTREYTTGNANIPDMAAAFRQIMEFEIRLAETNTKKIAVVESHRKLLQEIRNVVEARYKTGKSNQSDVLAIDLEISKLDLRALELKGD